MRIPIKGTLVVCPRNGEKTETESCKKCKYLGWVEEEKIVCRWTKEKEQFDSGERRYIITRGYETNRFSGSNI